MLKIKRNTLLQIQNNTPKKLCFLRNIFTIHFVSNCMTLQFFSVRQFWHKFVPILCELLISNYSSNRKIFKFPKEIRKAKKFSNM